MITWTSLGYFSLVYSLYVQLVQYFVWFIVYYWRIRKFSFMATFLVSTLRALCQGNEYLLFKLTGCCWLTGKFSTVYNSSNLWELVRIIWLPMWLTGKYFHTAIFSTMDYHISYWGGGWGDIVVVVSLICRSITVALARWPDLSIYLVKQPWWLSDRSRALDIP